MYSRFILAIGLLAVMAGYWAPSSPSVAPAIQEVGASDQRSSPVPPQPAVPLGNGFGEVSLPRAPDGHFYLDAQVNGATVHFLVDTGASTVALTRADAQAAGVQFGGGDFTGTAKTAGGEVALKPVMLDRVATGPLEARNVQAVVVDTPMSISLLGQSWLARVGTVTISGDRMVLR